MATRNPFSPAQQVVQVLREDSALAAKLKTESDPVKVVQEAADAAEKLGWKNDKWLYRIALGILGILALTAAIGAMVLAVAGKGETPPALVSIGSAAAGALVGLFAPSPVAKT